VNGQSGVLTHTSRFENVHILLWLIKDTCWMLEWKVLGCLMIAPTIAVAIYLAVRSAAEQVFNYAGFPFAVGFICVAIFYLRPVSQPEPV
jgi:hypothetical protein